MDSNRPKAGDLSKFLLFNGFNISLLCGLKGRSNVC